MTIEGRRHPDRDAQFRYISGMAGESWPRDPVVSVDAKKKAGRAVRAEGAEWRAKGDRVRVRDLDYPDKGGPGEVTPYGVYDIGANAWSVNVGTDHVTAAFAGGIAAPLVAGPGRGPLPGRAAAAGHRGRRRL